VPIENNTIYKHSRFVLFSGIIILLKVLFSKLREEVVGIKEA